MFDIVNLTIKSHEFHRGCHVTAKQQVHQSIKNARVLCQSSRSIIITHEVNVEYSCGCSCSCGLIDIKYRRLIETPLAIAIIQLLHAVTGSMAFCTLEGENGTRGQAEGAISPQGCTTPMDPSHNVQQLFCYLCIIVIPLLKVLLSSSNIITTDYSLLNMQTNKKQFPRTRGCFVHSAGNRPTIKVMYTCVHHFSCYPARRAM